MAVGVSARAEFSTFTSQKPQKTPLKASRAKQAVRMDVFLDIQTIIYKLWSI